jgi:hypothetical protein
LPDFALIATRARNEGFKTQVRGALIVKARAVYLAGEETSGIASWNFSIAVLREVGQFEGTAAMTLSTDPLIIGVPIATPISDADMETAMNRTWNALVGIRA